MADVMMKTIEDIESYQGSAGPPGQFLYAGKSLGVSSWGMNVLRLPAGWDGYPEHDHASDGQEEVYVVLKGGASLHAGNQTWSLEPGVLVRVGPNEKRKIVPGPSGVTILALGGAPGKPYERPKWMK